MTTLIQSLVLTHQAHTNASQAGNLEWADKHLERMDALEAKLPSGSGIDHGCHLERSSLSEKKMVVTFDYHHMDEHGYYCGWSNWTLTVRPSLAFDMNLVFKWHNNPSDVPVDLMDHLEEYLYDLFWSTLKEEL